MPTIDRLSSHPAVSWLRREAGRLRRAARSQHPAVRLGLVLAPLLVLAAAGYRAAGTLAASGPRYLMQGRAFSSDDLIRIFKALDAKGIPYRPVDRRIEVGADQYDEATALVGKLDVGPHSIREILGGPTPSFTEMFRTTAEREQQERLEGERVIERLIDNLDGVVWSLVRIVHPRASFPRAGRARPSAFVYVESESDRPLPLQTVQAIPKFVTGGDPELSAEAITVMDRKGRPYLDPSNPRLGKLNSVRLREQELRDDIADRLNWIKGVRIWVELGDKAEMAHEPTTGRDAGAPPSIVANQPADLDEPAPPPAEAPGRGRVLIDIPRSYYYSRMIPVRDDREPTVDELREAVAKTRDLVEGRVRPLIPASWTLEVGTIPDDVPTARPAPLAAGPDRRRIAADWGIVGAVAAAVAMAMAVGSWIQASRRPARSIAAPTAGRRYREDAPDEPEPTERVRELVRRDPEVAASVLQRWATQGGPAT